MKGKRTVRWAVFLAVAGFVGGMGFVYAEAPAAATEKKEWRFAITPYLWLPDLSTTLRHEGASGSKSAEVEVSAGDILEKLEMALPLALEARLGRRWFVFSDLIYMALGDEKSRVKNVDFGSGPIDVDASADVGTDTTLSITGWTVLGGYRYFESKKASFEPTFGFRYIGMEAETEWLLSGTVTGPGPGETFQKSGSIKETGELWDALIGCRGQFWLGQGRWGVPYYIDLGTGDSDFTWQAMLGISYGFKWGELSASYRHLEYHVGGSNLIQDIKFSGPTLGFAFRF
ncbi:MAG: hypothetical protein IPN19_01510 [Elusimicrobia bacterium]|nr:hypothetical protein [Elusimicrobiota bacterium]